jgi:hypothetical protein
VTLVAGLNIDGKTTKQKKQNKSGRNRRQKTPRTKKDGAMQIPTFAKVQRPWIPLDLGCAQTHSGATQEQNIPLDLGCMKIHRDDAVRAGYRQHVGH